MSQHTLLPVWLFPPSSVGWLKIDPSAWLSPLFFSQPLVGNHWIHAALVPLQRVCRSEPGVTNTLFQGLAQVWPPRPWTWRAPSPVPHPSCGLNKCQPLLIIGLVFPVLIHTRASHLGFTFHCWHLLQQNLTHLAPKVEPPVLSCNGKYSFVPGLENLASWGRWASGETIPRVLHPNPHSKCETTLELRYFRGKKKIPGKAFSFYLKIIYNILSLHKCFILKSSFFFFFNFFNLKKILGNWPGNREGSGDRLLRDFAKGWM